MEEIPPCYQGDNWEGVELDEFINCDSNLAANRQTRMLADLELIGELAYSLTSFLVVTVWITGCYDKTYMQKKDRDRIMLASAKKNLQSMAFFGLTEFQKISQYIFEETFNLRFAIPFEQNNSTVSSSTITSLTPSQAAKIAELNKLDLELYDFAKKLLMARFEKLKTRDVNFEERFSRLGVLNSKVSQSAFDWDRTDDTSDPE